MDGHGIITITAAGNADKTWIHPVSTDAHNIVLNTIWRSVLLRFSHAPKQNYQNYIALSY